MANHERDNFETKIEKRGGALAVILGVIAWDAQVVALGLVSILVGKLRTPKVA